jgi:hypothetical protein
MSMSTGTTKNKVGTRESRIDEALGESFPASDPPFYVGGGESGPSEGHDVAKQGVPKDDHGREGRKRPTRKS